jgi:high affinity sulfate transporter 1
MRMRLAQLPLIAGLAGYRPASFVRDVSAGLAVAAIGLPSAIAYPAIAGLPPETGLYASIGAAVGYALLGASRRLCVGPDAATMTMVAAVLTSMVAALPAAAEFDRVAAAATLALLVGALCLLARLLRLGVLATFLSRPILIGFFAGISISILVGQIGRVTGLSIEANGLLGPVLEAGREVQSLHWPTLGVAATSLALLQVTATLRLPIPGAVLAVVLSILLSWTLDFRGVGIAVVGDLPAALPRLATPMVPDLPLGPLLLGAGAIFLVAFGSGVVTARSFGERSGESVNADAELVGFAGANLAAGLVGGFPVTSSDSRTAINLSVGGTSQVVGLASAGTLVAALLFLAEPLALLPIPVLGALLIFAALGMIDLSSLRRLWQVSRIEFLFAVIAMAGAVSFGVLEGIAVSIFAALLHILVKDMYPRLSFLGRVDGRDGFYKMHRSANAHPVPGLTIVLVQGSLLFYNANYIGAQLESAAAALEADARWFVLDASAVAQIDSTGVSVLEAFAAKLAARGVSFGIAELHFAAQDLLRRAGVIGRIDNVMVFDDLHDALFLYQSLPSNCANGDGTHCAR